MHDNKAFSGGIEASFDFQKIKNSDEASIVFWNWLLDYLQLTPKSASVHDVFQQDCAAFFYDLDSDGIREIVGTHYATDISGRGSCYLYIVKADNNKIINYKLISGDLNFDISKPLYILNEKKNGYYIIQATSQKSGKKKLFVFNADKKIYIEK